MIKILLMLTCVLWSNDGAYTTSGNELIPVFESNISIKKEILTIKRMEDGTLDVKVEYTFLNPSSEKNVTVGFEAAPPNGDVDVTPINGAHPYIKEFSVIVNNQNIPYSVASYIEDENYTKNSKIVSKKFDSSYYSQESSVAYVYYFDATFKKGLNTIFHHYRYQYSTGIDTYFGIDYILTAAKRWANKQIDDFTLKLDVGEYTKFFITKSFFKNSDDWTIDGTMHDGGTSIYDGSKLSVVHLNKGMAVFHKKNFKIDGDLSLNARCNYWEDEFDYKRDQLPFMKECSRENIDTKDELSSEILKSLPRARRGEVFQNEKIQKYYESLDWYQKK